ncbi:hypothetical protein BXZ70DRAFT_910309 [Cristinia sonorae]|uniref:Uncharacterized protein n=1 Tax=Cristinia sonorae TaxID=1940300 RepID=A0A8K0UGV9_9AGAR|nr:hypothetical protein BXZ70DRAFT_910309 [Cristinia sonorae]
MDSIEAYDRRSHLKCGEGLNVDHSTLQYTARTASYCTNDKCEHHLCSHTNSEETNYCTDRDWAQYHPQISHNSPREALSMVVVRTTDDSSWYEIGSETGLMSIVHLLRTSTASSCTFLAMARTRHPVEPCSKKRSFIWIEVDSAVLTRRMGLNGGRYLRDWIKTYHETNPGRGDSSNHEITYLKSRWTLAWRRTVSYLERASACGEPSHPAIAVRFYYFFHWCN